VINQPTRRDASLTRNVSDYKSLFDNTQEKSDLSRFLLLGKYDVSRAIEGHPIPVPGNGGEARPAIALPAPAIAA